MASRLYLARVIGSPRTNSWAILRLTLKASPSLFYRSTTDPTSHYPRCRNLYPPSPAQLEVETLGADLCRTWSERTHISILIPLSIVHDRNRQGPRRCLRTGHASSTPRNSQLVLLMQSLAHPFAGATIPLLSLFVAESLARTRA